MRTYVYSPCGFPSTRARAHTPTPPSNMKRALSLDVYRIDRFGGENAAGEGERLAQADVAQGTTRAIPALSNGRLVIRTSGSGRGEISCLQVGQ